MAISPASRPSVPSNAGLRLTEMDDLALAAAAASGSSSPASYGRTDAIEGPALVTAIEAIEARWQLAVAAIEAIDSRVALLETAVFGE